MEKKSAKEKLMIYKGQGKITVGLFTPLNAPVSEMRAFLERLYQLDDDSPFINYYSLQRVENILSDVAKGMTYIAKVRNQIVGLVVYFPSARQGDPIYCFNPYVSRAGQFHVHPMHDQLEVTRMMIEKLSRFARYLLKSRLVVEVKGASQEQLETYRKLDFEPVPTNTPREPMLLRKTFLIRRTLAMGKSKKTVKKALIY